MDTGGKERRRRPANGTGRASYSSEHADSARRLHRTQEGYRIAPLQVEPSQCRISRCRSSRADALPSRRPAKPPPSRANDLLNRCPAEPPRRGAVNKINGRFLCTVDFICYICRAIRRKAGAFAAFLNCRKIYLTAANHKNPPFADRGHTSPKSGIHSVDCDPDGRGPLVYIV